VGVDVQKTDAGEASLVQITQSLHGLDGVIVPGPNRDPAITQTFGDFSRGKAIDFDRKSRNPAIGCVETYNPDTLG